MLRNFAVLFFLSFAVAPLASGFIYAGLYSLGLIGTLSHGFTFHHWISLFGDQAFWNSLALSTGIALFTLLLSLGLALLLLLGLQKELEQRVNYFLLHLPLALSSLVAAFLSFQWLGNSGMLARLAIRLGLIGQSQDFPELINDAHYLGVIFTLTLLTFPVFILLLLRFYQAENLSSLSHLAATLGASPKDIVFRVQLPALLRRITPTALLYFVFLFGAYEVPLLLGRQSPMMWSVYVSQKFKRFNLSDIPLAYSSTVFYALLILILVGWFWRKTTALNAEQ